MITYKFILDATYVVNAVLPETEREGRPLMTLELELEDLPSILNIMQQCIDGCLLSLDADRIRIAANKTKILN